MKDARRQTDAASPPKHRLIMVSGGMGGMFRGCGLLLALLCGMTVKGGVKAPEAVGVHDTNTPSIQVPVKYEVPVLKDAPPQTVASNAPTASTRPAPPPSIGQDDGTNSPTSLSEEELATRNIVDKKAALEKEKQHQFEVRLALARQHRLENNEVLAQESLVSLMESDAGEDIKKPAMLELALLAQQQNQPVRAIQIFSQYTQKYPSDPNVPEIMLRQGLLYRKLGSNNLALSKFYAVMTTSLALKLDHWERYQRLVLQAQTEIADTYFMQGKYQESIEYFQRLLKQDNADLNRAYVAYKVIRSHACLDQQAQVVLQCEDFLNRYPDAGEVPEVRYLYASALKKQGRNSDALRQVIALLESQSRSSAQSPQNWASWQLRTGNDIANQLYQEGDNASALVIYEALAKIDSTPAWQLPVRYQIGLVYEKLNQPQKASDSYSLVLEKGKDLKADAAPSLHALLDMAKWRVDFIAWQAKAEKSRQEVESGVPMARSQAMVP